MYGRWGKNQGKKWLFFPAAIGYFKIMMRKSMTKEKNPKLVWAKSLNRINLVS